MGEKVSFVDTTLRDGSQSNWAMGMPIGMMDAVMEDIDKVGYRSIEIPYQPLFFKKAVRDLKEDPWEMIKMMGKKAPNTIKGSMLGAGVGSFGTGGASLEVSKLFIKLLADYGVLQRVQIASNIVSSGRASFNWFIPYVKELGAEVAYAVAYYINSPIYTYDFYAKHTKLAVEMGADRLYLKDPCGLLTDDTVRDVLQIMQDNGAGLPIELHCHCVSALADATYVTALKQGICKTLHVSTPPLAEGHANPSVFNTAENVKALGFDIDLDLERAEHVSRRIYQMAKEDGLPTDFGPNRYRVATFIHRIPGGVMTNMIHQLRELHIQDRVDEVIEEIIRICAETGEPHIITPYAQFICTQAAINVAMGERYKVVIDNWITYAMGAFGEESGYLQMDPELRDKFLSLPRAKELKAIRENIANKQEMTLKEVRNLHGENLSDEELLLRIMMDGNDGEIETMRQATKNHPFRTYSCIDSPVLELIDELGKQPNITQVQVQLPDKSLMLKKGRSAD